MNTCGIEFSQTELAKLREKAYKMLKRRRIPHVRGCEEEAIRLAERWGESPTAAAAAAILHDCTKKLEPEEHLHLIKKYGVCCDEALLSEPKLYHALTGSVIAREKFKMPEEICSAIRWHTTGKPDMKLLEKIIYLADMIEPTRDFPGVEKIRSLACKNLDEALALALTMSMEEVRQRGAEPYYLTQEACDYYRKENHHALS